MKLRFTRAELEVLGFALQQCAAAYWASPDECNSARAKITAELAKDEAAVALGSRKSARKAVSSAANGRKGGRPKKVPGSGGVK